MIIIVIVVCIGFAGLFGYGYITASPEPEDFRLVAQALEVNAEQPADCQHRDSRKPMKQTFDLSLPGDAKASAGNRRASYARQWLSEKLDARYSGFESAGGGKCWR